jgi:DNA-binding GntR family transcriptional regulator
LGRFIRPHELPSEWEVAIVLSRAKLGQQVYEVLEGMIHNRRFQPGGRLNIEQIAKELGVSRTPVWEAVARLEREGLVTSMPHRGVFMAVLTHQDAHDLYELRQVTEALAARLAASHIDEAALARMEASLSAQSEAVAANDVVAYSSLDFEFHGIIYEYCNNPHLREALALIKNKMRPLNIHIEPILPLLYGDHQELVAALKARRGDEAEAVAFRHNKRMIEAISLQVTMETQPSKDQDAA